MAKFNFANHRDKDKIYHNCREQGHNKLSWRKSFDFLHLQGSQNLKHNCPNLKQNSQNLKQDSQKLKQDSQNFKQESQNFKQYSQNLKQDSPNLKGQCNEIFCQFRIE